MIPKEDFDLHTMHNKFRVSCSHMHELPFWFKPLSKSQAPIAISSYKHHEELCKYVFLQTYEGHEREPQDVDESGESHDPHESEEHEGHQRCEGHESDEEGHESGQGHESGEAIEVVQGPRDQSIQIHGDEVARGHAISLSRI